MRGKTYDTDDPDYDYVEMAFRSHQGGARIDPIWDRDLVGIDLDADRYGPPVLARHRLGQGGFRLSVLAAYDGCAISGSRATPALEAAHIRDYARGGRHVVSNGLALRSDLHRLYDRGYLGIDDRYRLRVSPRLRSEYGNGVALYEQEARGDVIRLPRRPEDQPSRAALTWHMDEVFKSA